MCLPHCLLYLFLTLSYADRNPGNLFPTFIFCTHHCLCTQLKLSCHLRWEAVQPSPCNAKEHTPHWRRKSKRQMHLSSPVSLFLHAVFEEQDHWMVIALAASPWDEQDKKDMAAKAEKYIILTVGEAPHPRSTLERKAEAPHPRGNKQTNKPGEAMETLLILPEAS